MSLTFLIIFLLSPAMAAAVELRLGYYSKTCPKAEVIVRSVIAKNMEREARSAASVSHASTIPRDATVLVLSARDGTVLSGGPMWNVKLGRVDSLTARQQDSDSIMPSPRSNSTHLIDLFSRFNLSVKDLVALSGSHSIGKGRCFSIVFRLYNQSGSGKPDPTMEPKFRARLQKLCPPAGGDGNVTGDLDATGVVFDNQYFKDLVEGRGFLNSDQSLFTTPQTRGYVMEFSQDQNEFFNAFVEGMIKMGDLQSRRPGKIRRNCRVVNT